MQARAQERERAGDYAGALAEIAPAVDFGVAPVTLLAGAEKERLIERANAAGQADAQAAHDAADALFARALGEVVAESRRAGIPAAASATAAMLSRADLEPARPALVTLSADVAALARAEDALAARLEKARGEELRLTIASAERSGAIDGVREGRVFVKLAIGTVSYALDEVDVAEWLGPAQLGGAAASARLQGLLHILRGEDDDARRALAEAARLGEDVRIYAARAAKN
jgi:hypothetical protein